MTILWPPFVGWMFFCSLLFRILSRTRVKSTLDVRSRDLVTVLITDGDLGNINESVSYFRDYLNDDNKLYIFLLGGSKSLHSYEPLKNIGAKIYNANNANEFCDMVLTDME